LIPTLNRLAGITGGKPPDRSTKSPAQRSCPDNK